MKNKLIFIITGIVILALVLVIVIFREDPGKYLHEIGYTELKEMVDNKESFILVGERSDCDHCKTYMPKFQKIVVNHKIQAYYINLQELTEEENTAMKSEIVDIKGTPTTVFFEDGVELGSQTRIVGDLSIDYVIDKLTLRGYIKE
jgi:Thioredoxin.